MYFFPYLEPVCCSMSSSNCCFLTCIQISKEAGKMDRYYQLLKNFPQFVVIHTIKGFDIVNKAEVDAFMELSCFFYYQIGNLISGSSAFSKSSLYIWKFSVHCWSLIWRILSISLLTYEISATVAWAFFGIAFLWDWNGNWPFPVLWPLLSFPNLLAYWVQHFHSIILQDLK